MDNKLGLSNDALLQIENQLVNFKISLLNEYFTFNLEKIDIQYLQKLHEYLFIDIYENAGKLSSRMEETDIKFINEKMNNILLNINYISYDETKELILDNLNDIINLQPFEDGNFRTLKSFLTVWLMANKLDTTYNLISGDSYRSLKIINKEKNKMI